MQCQELLTDIILLDLVGFSKLTNEDQLAAVMKLAQTLRATIGKLIRIRGSDVSTVVLGFIPTGDGIYVILNEKYVGYGVLLSLSLRNTITDYPTRRTPSSLSVRIAVNTGLAVPFTDITGKGNFVGDGLNDTARLLALPAPLQKTVTRFTGDDNFVVASVAAVARHEDMFDWYLQSELAEAALYRKSEQYNFTDKHGKSHAFHAVESDRGAVFAP